MIGRRNRLSDRWLDKTKEADCLHASINELMQQLSNMGTDQSGEAQQLLSNTLKKYQSLNNQEQNVLHELQDLIQEHFPGQRDDILRIRSLNGDIKLNVTDPGASVSISPEFNQRLSFGNNETIVAGHPPENPERIINIFTFRGRIIIGYPHLQGYSI